MLARREVRSATMGEGNGAGRSRALHGAYVSVDRRAQEKRRAHRCSEKILICVSRIRELNEPQPRNRRAHIFLLRAVMSREALITRSRRSWCSSSSARKVVNIEVKDEDAVEAAIGLGLWV